MKVITIWLLLMAMATGLPGYSQTTNAMQPFTGAVAQQDHYKAIYYLNDSSAKAIKGTLRNIKNVMEDPRLAGKIEIELVAFGDGVEVFKKTNPYDSLLKSLQEKGVLLAQCLNTMKERNIEKSELWNFISYVPTGNGEIIIRQAQGWATVHP